MEIAKEQHHRLEEARLNITVQFTTEDETYDAENYGETRCKTTSRAKLTSVVSQHFASGGYGPKL